MKKVKNSRTENAYFSLFFLNSAVLSGRVFFIALCFVFLSSCATVPYTGRTQFLLISETEEKSIGDQAWREVLSRERQSNNAFYNTVVRECGWNIAKVANRPDFHWEFRVFDNPEVNAFCLPGGKIGVYCGLLNFTANEAELAAVIGHEVGHAIARHGGERMSQGLLQQVGAEILKASLGGNANTEAWLIAYAGITSVGVILPYSRTHEYEADRIGMILMAKAGYDPRAAISFWQRMSARESKIDQALNFLSTHPTGPDRIEEMKGILQDAMKEYQAAPVKRGLGRQISSQFFK